MGYLGVKYEATASSYLAQHKDWKQGGKASQALSNGNKIDLPAPLQLTNSAKK